MPITALPESSNPPYRFGPLTRALPIQASPSPADSPQWTPEDIMALGHEIQNTPTGGVPITAPEGPGELFTQQVAKGYRGLQATGYGALGMAGSALGIDPLRKFGYEGYQAKTEEGAKYAEGQKFLDIKNPLDFSNWFIGTLGNLLPSMAEAAITATIGAVIGSAIATPGAGTAGGAATGFFAKRAVKKMFEEGARHFIGKGLTKQAARRKAQDLIEKQFSDAGAKYLFRKQVMRELGGRAGIIAGVMPVEAGGNWAENYEKGIDNPWSAMATGTASAFLEIAGGQSRWIGKFLGPKAETAFRKALNGKDIGRVARIAREAAIQGGGEYLQEAGQEFLSLVNVALNDPDFNMFTQENFYRMFEAGMAGAAMGFTSGGMAGVFSRNMKKIGETEKKPAPGDEQIIDLVDKAKPKPVPEAGPTEQDIVELTDLMSALPVPFRQKPTPLTEIGPEGAPSPWEEVYDVPFADVHGLQEPQRALPMGEYPPGEPTGPAIPLPPITPIYMGPPGVEPAPDEEIPETLSPEEIEAVADLGEKSLEDMTVEELETLWDEEAEAITLSPDEIAAVAEEEELEPLAEEEIAAIKDEEENRLISAWVKRKWEEAGKPEGQAGKALIDMYDQHGPDEAERLIKEEQTAYEDQEEEPTEPQGLTPEEIEVIAGPEEEELEDIGLEAAPEVEAAKPTPTQTAEELGNIRFDKHTDTMGYGWTVTSGVAKDASFGTRTADVETVTKARDERIAEWEEKATKKEPAPVKKEPWEMTRADWQNEIYPVSGMAYKLKDKYLTDEIVELQDKYDDARKKQIDWKIKEYGKKLSDSKAARLKELFALHEQSVQQALSDGLPVPESVLKDYPELKKAPAEKAEPETLTEEEITKAVGPEEALTLSDIEVETTAIREATGEEVKVTETAQEALDWIDERSEAYHSLIECLGGP